MLQTAAMQPHMLLQCRQQSETAPFRSGGQTHRAAQHGVSAFQQHRTTTPSKHSRVTAAATSSNRSSADPQAAETAVLEALRGVRGRGSGGLPPQQLAAFEDAVKTLEADGGVKVGGLERDAPACRLPEPHSLLAHFADQAAYVSVGAPKPLKHAASQAPTASDQINGRWRLLFTSKPGTASPIQRTFTGVDAFSIFQVDSPGSAASSGHLGHQTSALLCGCGCTLLCIVGIEGRPRLRSHLCCSGHHVAGCGLAIDRQRC